MLFLLVFALSSCSTTLPSDSNRVTATQPPVIIPITSTPTEIPPTPSPTPKPLPQITDYLLTTSDVPNSFSYGPSYLTEIKDGEDLIASLMFFNVLFGSIQEIVQVSKQPFSSIPKQYQLGTQMPAPKIGDGTMQFNNSNHYTLVFYKGNVLVSLTTYSFDQANTNDQPVKLDQEAMASLAELIESRLPDLSTVSLDIQIPEKTDYTLFSKYFTEMKIGTGYPDDVFSEKLAFTSSEQICWRIVPIDQKMPFYDVLVVNTKTNESVQLIRRYFTTYPSCGPYSVTKGSYKLFVIVADTIVSSTDFEVK